MANDYLPYHPTQSGERPVYLFLHHLGRGHFPPGFLILIIFIFFNNILTYAWYYFVKKPRERKVEESASGLLNEVEDDEDNIA